MQKIVLFFLLLSGLLLKSQTIIFTDVNLFNKLILKGVDANKDGFITTAEAALIQKLKIDSANISSIDDLAAFTNLKWLSAKKNNLTSINQTVYSRLSYLNFTNNKVTALPSVSASNLDSLYCDYNLMATFPLTDAPKLLFLSLKGNPSTSVNLTGLSTLKGLNVDNTLIKTLDLSGLGSLKTMSGSSVSLDTIISHSKYKLGKNDLWVFSKVSNINLSNNSDVDSVYVSWYNSLNDVNLNNCANLKYVYIVTTPVKTLSLNNDPLINYLNVNSYTGTSTLQNLIKDIPNIENITIGKVTDTKLDYLNQLLKLKTANITLSNVDTLRLIAHPTLTSFFVNKVSNLFIDNCQALTSVGGYSTNVSIDNCNKFTSFAVNSIVSVSILNCATFKTFPQGWSSPCDFSGTIKKVKINNCPMVENVTVAWYFSKLTDLDVKGCTNLKILSVSGNTLSTLDLSTNLLLEQLSCNDNKFKTLDVSMLPNLNLLNCNTNQLKTLDLTQPHKLNYLNVQSNDTTLYICVNDTAKIGISTVLANIPVKKLFKLCSLTSSFAIENPNKKIVESYDLTGRPIDPSTKNKVIILIYDDGTRKKTCVLE